MSRLSIQTLRRKVMRRITQRLFPQASKTGFHAHALFSRFNALPQLDAAVPGGNVVVLAPHMDDEVFGCGGALIKHVKSGAKVTVIYMTDGRKGDPSIYTPGLSEQDMWMAEQEVVVRRTREAQEAAEIIGIHEQVYLNFSDGELTNSREAVNALRSVLQRTRPHRIYLPSLLENHVDHWQTNCVFRDVLSESEGRFTELSCWGYEIWPPLYANRIIDISDVVETKKKAVDRFQSQLSHMDYARGILSLNSYRSFFHNRAQGYAEAFFSCRADEYLSLFRRMKLYRNGHRSTRSPQQADSLIAVME